MSTAFVAEAVPLRRDEQGDIRVGESRVLLDLVVRAFDDGATPEGIVQMYSTLKLHEVYAAIAYYLGHPRVVAEYLLEREQRADAVCRSVRNGQDDMSKIHARLLARQSHLNGSNTPLAQ